MVCLYLILQPVLHSALYTDFKEEFIMKKKILIAPAIILTITSFNIILSKTNVIKSAYALTVTYSGDSTRVCATAGSCTMYSHMIILSDELTPNVLGN